MSARRAYSHDGSDGAYSDDFISDEDRRTHSPYRSYGGGGGAGAHSRDRIRARGGGGVQRGRGRGKARRGGRGNSRASEPISMKHDTVTKRVLSASRNRINELRNQVEELKITIRDLEAENKLFKKLQFRQEKAIKHFEDKENDLPRILEKHGNELRVLKEQNRRLREKYERTDHYLRDAEDELERVKKRMNKYKDMCEQKELLERDELSRKVTKAEIDMEEKDVKIKELERHMEILKKNHRHELGIEMARQKELRRQVEEMTNKNNDVETQLKEKSKQLEYKNIYSQSITLASQDNSSTADHSPSRKLKKRASLTDLTPRDKAKFYEEKRRVEVKKQKEIKAEQDKKKRQKWEKEEQERIEREKEREKERGTSESPRRASESPRHAPPPDFNFLSIDKSLEEKERDLSSRKRYREEQEEYRRQSERDRNDLYEKKKELEKRQEEDKWKREEEERERRQRENREREERERRQREDSERQDRERRERTKREEEERQMKEKEERDRREMERVEQERRVQLEKEKLDNDPNLREERRKKDELLRKLQEMDKIGNNPSPKKDPDSFHSKENTTGYDTPGSKKSDPKEYSFTNPVLNLHKGKPARDDVTVPYIQRQRQRASKDDDEFGYTPSFGPGRGGNKPASKPLSLFDDDNDNSSSTLKFDTSSSTTTTSKKPNKSSNLLENLFGPAASTTTTNNSTNKSDNKLSKGQDSETFFITGNSPTREPRKMNGVTSTTTTSTAFPWDNNNAFSSPAKSNRSAFDNGGSSTLFGGGAAVIDDDLTSNNNRALPRRARQNNVSTFSAKPSVTAVDPFDDEIEEVVL